MVAAVVGDTYIGLLRLRYSVHSANAVNAISFRLQVAVFFYYFLFAKTGSGGGSTGARMAERVGYVITKQTSFLFRGQMVEKRIVNEIFKSIGPQHIPCVRGLIRLGITSAARAARHTARRRAKMKHQSYRFGK